MSPAGRIDPEPQVGFPRVSGDEPDATDKFKSTLKFSPRERG